MIRFLVAPPCLQRRHVARATASFAIALAASCLPFAAQAQFNGNPDTDLLSTPNAGKSTDATNSSGSNPRMRVDDDTDPSTADGRDDASSTLRQPARNNRQSGQSGQPDPRDTGARGLPRYQPGEFELYVQRQAAALASAANAATPVANDGTDPAPRRTPLVRRFGANLLTDPTMNSATFDPLPTVPGDYVIRPGDEIVLTVWGSADADLRLTVDRSGRIAIPRVGAVMVGGLRDTELEAAISRRVGQVFRNFQLTASIGRVRPIRVFVGGYAQRPGSIAVSGLSSVLHVLMRAGGPSAAGSFRDIHLRRGGREVAQFDLYDLLLRGDRNADQLVQPDDVIFVGPIGTQVAVLGSVNEQAIFELKPGETVADLIHMAGGFNAVADRSRVAVERLADRATGHVTELALPAHNADALAAGDLVRVFSVITAAIPKEYQNERVRVQGEVVHPGDYVLPPGSKVSDALRAAGGVTPGAYIYGTEFTRDSVRRIQEVNYDRALRDFETDISRNQASQRVTSSEEIAAQTAAAAANERLLARLREVRPTGRVVLQVTPTSATLPELALEDGDSINIPTRNSSVGVFGSVFTTGNFLFEPNHTVADYLALAGGPTRGADKRSIFMLRANGSVVSARQGSSFWHSGSDLADAQVQPGDTLFVPEEIDKSTFVQNAKDWTQILYQFGLGLAGIKSLGL